MHPEQYVVRSPQTASRVIDGEAIVLTSRDGTFRVLNEAGSRIWELLRDPKTIRDIVTTLCRVFDVEKGQAMADTIAFLEELEIRGMIELMSVEGSEA